MLTLDTLTGSDHYGYMEDGQAVVERVLQEVPGSLRALAREAGVSHGLLVAIRQGRRSLTPETREKLVGALRSWGETCHALAATLSETAPPEPGGSHE